MNLQEEVLYWKKLATTDVLTEMPNRRALDSHTATRDGWFVACDLNGFKTAQDQHPLGHEHGDRILRDFGKFAESCTRTADRMAARTGGDEFTFWCSTEAGALRIRDRVRNWVCDIDFSITCAAGVGRTNLAADAAMYSNKNS